MHLPWWGVLCVMVGAFPLLFLFDHFGKLALVRPTLYSAAIITITIAMRWKLRRHVWFWVTTTLLAALHLPLILFVPWTTKWVPAIVIIPVGIADSYAMLWAISVVGKFMERPRTSER
jgi:chromate transport protein ChrA